MSLNQFCFRYRIDERCSSTDGSLKPMTLGAIFVAQLPCASQLRKQIARVMKKLRKFSEGQLYRKKYRTRELFWCCATEPEILHSDWSAEFVDIMNADWRPITCF